MKNRTLSEFTQLTSSHDPIPGGGGVSALTGALAASLAEMVTSLTSGKKQYAAYQQEIEQIMAEAEVLRVKLLDDIDRDGEAFLPLAKAYGGDHNAPDYREHLEACLLQAAKAPLEVMRSVCRVIELDERLALIGSKLAVSDAGVSVILAHGALLGSAVNVTVNTRLMQDRQMAEKLDRKADEMVSEYGERALNCYRAVKERL